MGNEFNQCFCFFDITAALKVSGLDETEAVEQMDLTEFSILSQATEKHLRRFTHGRRPERMGRG